VDNPCFLELIWSYWHEEGMLVQCMNAIGRRFQNLHAPGRRDPLAHVEIDPLRPLNNILWGYVEDEGDRLSVRRRAFEYQHHYGLNLYGKAVSALRPADNRSEFIEAFHNLLNKCADYYRAKQDTTVDPDGYPILHAIQELNLILAQGAHNQFGDLPWTARVEMLMQQWILARPEIRDFLQSRAMVPHKEDWMPQVDTMKTLQRWTNVAVTHFRDLAVFGEQILLTIRWHNWYDVTSEDEAKGWADLLRAQIQSYIHAYRAVTGVDLSTTERVDYTMPSVHLRKRLALQQRVG
jgi:nicotinamide mononucleotide adenylyltransferase